MYAANWGRFNQPDTVGYAGGANLYAYVGNDPLNANDPDGKFINFIVGGIVAAGVDVTAQYVQARLTGQPFNINLTRTAVAFGAGVLTSGASAFVGGAVEGIGAGAVGSFALRTTGNAAVGALGNVAQTATLNSLEGTNDSLLTAAGAGAGFGAAGSVLADTVPAINSAIRQAKFGNLDAGNQNLVNGIGDLSGVNPTAANPLATAAGAQVGNAVGAGTSFVGGSGQSGK
jgi:hypothetical protein